MNYTVSFEINTTGNIIDILELRKSIKWFLKDNRFIYSKLKIERLD